MLLKKCIVRDRNYYIIMFTAMMLLGIVPDASFQLLSYCSAPHIPVCRPGIRI